MAQLQIPAVQSFNPHGEPSNTSQRWEKWKKSFGYFITASGITDDGRKRALLLHLVGEETQEIFETFPAAEQGESYDEALNTLNNHFKVKKNVPFERSTFNRAKQQTDESIEQFSTRLRKLSLYCEYGDSVDEHIRDRIIDACSSQKLRHKL